MIYEMRTIFSLILLCIIVIEKRSRDWSAKYVVPRLFRWNLFIVWIDNNGNRVCGIKCKLNVIRKSCGRRSYCQCTRLNWFWRACGVFYSSIVWNRLQCTKFNQQLWCQNDSGFDEKHCVQCDALSYWNNDCCSCIVRKSLRDAPISFVVFVSVWLKSTEMFQWRNKVEEEESIWSNHSGKSVENNQMNLDTLIDFNCIVLHFMENISLASIINRHRYFFTIKREKRATDKQQQQLIKVTNEQMPARISCCHLWCGRFDRNTIRIS